MSISFPLRIYGETVDRPKTPEECDNILALVNCELCWAIDSKHAAEDTIYYANETTDLKTTNDYLAELQIDIKRLSFYRVCFTRRKKELAYYIRRQNEKLTQTIVAGLMNQKDVVQTKINLQEGGMSPLNAIKVNQN